MYRILSRGLISFSLGYATPMLACDVQTVADFAPSSSPEELTKVVIDLNDNAPQMNAAIQLGLNAHVLAGDGKQLSFLLQPRPTDEETKAVMEAAIEAHKRYRIVPRQFDFGRVRSLIESQRQEAGDRLLAGLQVLDPN